MSSLLNMNKERIQKDHDQYDNMEKKMTHLDLLCKDFIKHGLKGVHMVGASSGNCLEDAKFEV